MVSERLLEDPIVLSEQATLAIERIKTASVLDVVGLISICGYDKTVFFEDGDFDGVDFRGSDVLGVSFKLTSLRGAFFYSDQYLLVESTKPRDCEGVVVSDRPDAGRPEAFASGTGEKRAGYDEISLGLGMGASATKTKLEKDQFGSSSDDLDPPTEPIISQRVIEQIKLLSFREGLALVHDLRISKAPVGDDIVAALSKKVQSPSDFIGLFGLCDKLSIFLDTSWWDRFYQLRVNRRAGLPHIDAAREESNYKLFEIDWKRHRARLSKNNNGACKYKKSTNAKSK